MEGGGGFGKNFGGKKTKKQGIKVPPPFCMTNKLCVVFCLLVFFTPRIVVVFVCLLRFYPTGGATRIMAGHKKRRGKPNELLIN